MSLAPQVSLGGGLWPLQGPGAGKGTLQRTGVQCSTVEVQWDPPVAAGEHGGAWGGRPRLPLHRGSEQSEGAAGGKEANYRQQTTNNKLVTKPPVGPTQGRATTK